MEQPTYQRIVTESELDAICQQFVEREFPKAVKSVNRFSGKANPPATAKPTEGKRHGR
jgi:hypothetical protein